MQKHLCIPMSFIMVVMGVQVRICLEEHGQCNSGYTWGKCLFHFPFNVPSNSKSSRRGWALWSPSHSKRGSATSMSSLSQCFTMLPFLLPTIRFFLPLLPDYSWWGGVGRNDRDVPFKAVQVTHLFPVYWLIMTLKFPQATAKWSSSNQS